MATQSNILAWKIPWTEELGGLQFMGSQRVRHWRDLACMHSYFTEEELKQKQDWLLACLQVSKWKSLNLMGSGAQLLFATAVLPVAYYTIHFLKLFVLCWDIAMATHSSTLVWKIPWMEAPGRLQSMGSLRVGHDWVTSLSLLRVLGVMDIPRVTSIFLSRP